MGTFTSNSLLQSIGIGLMVLGFIGAVLPVLPAAPMIFLGALLWAWADEFRHVGAGSLAAIGVIGAIAWASEWVLAGMAARRTGATWKTVAGAIGCGLLGGLAGSALLPVIGTLLGAAAGAAGGALAVEYWQRRAWEPAWRAARSYCLGSLLSVVLNLALCVAMLVIFWWSART